MKINTSTGSGTSLHGYISGPTVQDLERVLGPSIGPSDKVLAEWTFATVEGPATLYDWKNQSLDGVTFWHVGALKPTAVHEVAQYLRNKGLTVREERA